MSSSNNDDYDPQKTVADLVANFEQPDRFAQIFCKAAEKQKSIDEVLQKNIKHLLQHDKETIDCIKNLQRQVDKEDWRYFLKKMGIGGWTIIVVILTALIDRWLKH
jgi:hypothetical protein